MAWRPHNFLALSSFFASFFCLHLFFVSFFHLSSTSFILIKFIDKPQLPRRTQSPGFLCLPSIKLFDGGLQCESIRTFLKEILKLVIGNWILLYKPKNSIMKYQSLCYIDCTRKKLFPLHTFF